MTKNTRIDMPIKVGIKAIIRCKMKRVMMRESWGLAITGVRLAVPLSLLYSVLTSSGDSCLLVEPGLPQIVDRNQRRGDIVLDAVLHHAVLVADIQPHPRRF